jgi:hypothetical protein
MGLTEVTLTAASSSREPQPIFAHGGVLKIGWAASGPVAFDPRAGLRQRRGG